MGDERADSKVVKMASSMVLRTAVVKVEKRVVRRDKRMAFYWVAISAAWKVAKSVQLTVAMLVASRVSIKVGQTVELLADEKGVKTVDEMVAKTVVLMVSVMVLQKAVKMADKME